MCDRFACAFVECIRENTFSPLLILHLYESIEAAHVHGTRLRIEQLGYYFDKRTGHHRCMRIY
jgi:hypothetical protein